MTTENNEEQSAKPGYIDLLNSLDYYHHIKDATNQKRLRFLSYSSLQLSVN